MLTGIFAVSFGYLLGSIPAAYIMCKIRKGIDIRTVDVHNMGAGSTFRQCGIWEGAVVAIVDVGKGALAVLAAGYMGADYIFVLAAGFAALLGHNFPFSIGFKGGQGVSTVMGVFLVLAPQAMVLMLIVMAVVLLITRHIFSMIFIVAPFLPLFVWISGLPGLLIIFSVFIVAYIIFRSRSRLRELRFLPGHKKEI
jgi:glycerol-3-phosphate acyltransferase PlsY